MGATLTGARACWCGAREAWFADEEDGPEESCGGTGMLNCFCGGDQCVCHNHGAIPCGGCEDCDQDEDGGFDD